MRASIVCDEFNAPDFVTLRNLAATNPPVNFSLKGHSIESTIQNSKNQEYWKRSMRSCRSSAGRSSRRRATERPSRIFCCRSLCSSCRRRWNAFPMVGEWKQSSWTKDELAAAFTSELKWERLQKMEFFAPFEPKIPSTLADAVANGYRLDRMPPQNDWTWMSLIGGKAPGGFGTALVKGLFMAALGLGGADCYSSSLWSSG